MPCAGQLLQTLKGHGSAVTCLKFSRHTNLLLSGSFDKAAIVWQADTGVQMQRIIAHTGTHVAPYDPSGHLSTCCSHSFLLVGMTEFIASPVVLICACTQSDQACLHGSTQDFGYLLHASIMGTLLVASRACQGCIIANDRATIPK